jgi:hypothetical protein
MTINCESNTELKKVIVQVKNQFGSYEKMSMQPNLPIDARVINDHAIGKRDISVTNLGDYATFFGFNNTLEMLTKYPYNGRYTLKCTEYAIQDILKFAQTAGLVTCVAVFGYAVFKILDRECVFVKAA